MPASSRACVRACVLHAFVHACAHAAFGHVYVRAYSPLLSPSRLYALDSVVHAPPSERTSGSLRSMRGTATGRHGNVARHAQRANDPRRSCVSACSGCARARAHTRASSHLHSHAQTASCDVPRRNSRKTACRGRSMVLANFTTVLIWTRETYTNSHDVRLFLNLLSTFVNCNCNLDDSYFKNT